jgi:hypothetical protein
VFPKHVFATQHSSLASCELLPPVNALFAHVFAIRHRTSHPFVQLNAPPSHAFIMLQSITHAVATAQLTVFLHDVIESHSILHFIAAGHTTLLLVVT